MAQRPSLKPVTFQNVIAQNDQLKAESERLSEALESATALIQDTTQSYAKLKDQLANAEGTIHSLLDDNRVLRQQVRVSWFSDAKERFS